METHQLSRRIRFLSRKNAGFGRLKPAQNTGLESRINWEAPNYVKLNEHNILAKILWNFFPVRGFLTHSVDFVSNRFPSFLRLDKKNDGITPVAQIPIGGERTLKFLTDVENEYFDRIEDPGTLEIELRNFSPNDTTGGNAPGPLKKLKKHLMLSKPARTKE